MELVWFLLEVAENPTGKAEWLLHHSNRNRGDGRCWSIQKADHRQDTPNLSSHFFELLRYTLLNLQMEIDKLLEHVADKYHKQKYRDYKPTKNYHHLLLDISFHQQADFDEFLWTFTRAFILRNETFDITQLLEENDYLFLQVKFLLGKIILLVDIWPFPRQKVTLAPELAK